MKCLPCSCQTLDHDSSFSSVLTVRSEIHKVRVQLRLCCHKGSGLVRILGFGSFQVLIVFSASEFLDLFGSMQNIGFGSVRSVGFESMSISNNNGTVIVRNENERSVSYVHCELLTFPVPPLSAEF